jgi:hypothetical protein
MGGLQSLDIFSKPKIVRLSSKANDVGVEWRYLHVNVTLKTDKVQLAGLGLIGPQTQGSWLPALPVPRLIVPIVRSAYMHIHKNFKGTSKGINLTDPDKIPGAAFWLIHPDSGVLGNLPAGIVPGDLPQVLDNAASSVNAAMDVFGALLQAGGTFSYLAGLVPLQDSIKALGQKGITTEVGEGVKQLNDYDLVLNNTSFLGIETENDIEAEDEVSALICTGAPGDYMMFYGDDSYDGDDDDDGSFRIEVGPAGFTIVNALDMKTLKTNPKGMFRQFYKPDNDTWDEEISSVRMI